MEAERWLAVRFLERLFGYGDTPKPPEEYDAPFKRATRQVPRLWLELQDRRRKARRVVGKLLRRSVEEQPTRIKKSYWNLKTPQVARELLRRGKAVLRFDAQESARLGELALLVLDELSPEGIEEGEGERCIHDLRAEVLGHVGNAERICCLVQSAYQRFAAAFGALEGGTGAPQLEARLFRLYASLLKDRGHYETALCQLDSALVLYRQLEDRHRQGLVQVQRGTVLAEQEQILEAIEANVEGGLLLDEDRSPAAAAGAWINGADFYARLGEPDKARQVLENAEGPLERL